MKPLGLLLGVLIIPLACKPSAPPPATKTAPPAAAVTKATPRLIILGFDGVDPRHVETMVQAGKLPAIKALGEQGHRGTLRSTNPPQSPVAWATFATGTQAGEHGIFDFVGRNPATYFPEIATTRVRHAEINGSEFTPTQSENLRRGPAFWDQLATRGVRATALRVPYNYPLPANGATALAGLGAPDARGINSSFTLLTTDKKLSDGPPPAGGQYAALTPLADGRLSAQLEGPTPKVDGAKKKTQTSVEVAVSAGGVALRVGGESLNLTVGQTSPYVNVHFDPSNTVKIRAATRFTLRSLDPLAIYVEPLSMVPDAPYFPISSPAGFAVGLWQRFGATKTVGWVDDTNGLSAGAMDESQFLREAMATMRWETEVLLATLKDNENSLVVGVFTSADRIGHMFYRHLDTSHPQYDAAKAAPYASALDDAYVEMDHILAKVVAQLGKDDTLLVMSDHGFGSFRRGFNINSWLRQKGYLTVKKGVTAPRDFFADVDWQKTQAYALGTGSIYLNLKGREAQGSVGAEEVAALAAKIAKDIVRTKDGKIDAVAAAYLGDEIYHGGARESAPDVRVALFDGYRASWGTSLGGLPAGLFEDNTKAWSGDHASMRPEEVPGILFSNRPISAESPGLEDFAPTAYKFFEQAVPATWPGKPLF